MSRRIVVHHGECVCRGWRDRHWGRGGGACLSDISAPDQSSNDAAAKKEEAAKKKEEEKLAKAKAKEEAERLKKKDPP